MDTMESPPGSESRPIEVIAEEYSFIEGFDDDVYCDSFPKDNFFDTVISLPSSPISQEIEGNGKCILANGLGSGFNQCVCVCVCVCVDDWMLLHVVNEGSPAPMSFSIHGNRVRTLAPLPDLPIAGNEPDEDKAPSLVFLEHSIASYDIVPSPSVNQYCSHEIELIHIISLLCFV